MKLLKKIIILFVMINNNLMPSELGYNNIIAMCVNLIISVNIIFTTQLMKGI